MYFRRGRRLAPDDNLAWPGLVDLFAFGMVIVLVLWSASGAGLSDSEIAKTREKNAKMVELVKQLEKTVAEKDNELKEVNQALAVYEGKATEQQAEAEKYRKIEVQRLLQDLRGRLGQEWDSSLRLSADGLQIYLDNFGGETIEFKSRQFDLLSDHALLIRDFSVALDSLVEKYPFILRISGKADPRNMINKDAPRDNIDLSALRAASVSRELKKVSASLASNNRIQVVGLGAMGVMPDQSGWPKMTDQQVRAKLDTELQQYRTVELVLEIDPTVSPTSGSTTNAGQVVQ